MIRTLMYLISASILLILNGCSNDAPNTIRIGVIAGPETQLMETAKEIAKKKYGLNVKIIEFSDYNIPNAALSDGSIDANMFQHLPYLQSSIKANGYALAPLGKTFIYPMAMYSRTLSSLKELKNGAKVAIPNDPSNEARALQLLQKAGLIKLSSQYKFSATPQDITSNPKKLTFIELDAAQLPRVLEDVSIAVINTNYVISSGIPYKKYALFSEDSSSPYANLLVVKSDDLHKKKFRELLAAIQSPAVLNEANKIFKGLAVPAWKKKIK